MVVDDDMEKLAVLSLPSKPDPELSPVDVVHALCSGLKHNNIPTPDAGKTRCFEFTTYECRAALTSRKGYKYGLVERFIEHAELYTLVGSLSYVVGEPTLIPGTQTRGALCSICVDVTEQYGFRGPSGFERQPLPEDAQRYRVREDGVAEVRTERFRFELEQQRRPPLIGCWMVKALMPMREHMMFNGDSGAVQG